MWNNTVKAKLREEVALADKEHGFTLTVSLIVNMSTLFQLLLNTILNTILSPVSGLTSSQEFVFKKSIERPGTPFTYQS